MRRFPKGSAAVAEGVFSFHLMRDACLAGQAEGWRRFLRAYAPLARHLLERYFPSQDTAALLAEVFRGAQANQAELWRTFAGSSEKEFLLHFRGFVMGQARAARGAPPETPLTPEAFWNLLQGFPLFQQEMLVLSVRRYTPEELNEIMKFKPETARAVLAQAQEKLRGQLGEKTGSDLLARDLDPLFAAYEAQRGEKCLADRTYREILDGQITWRDRQAAERHIEDCPYCLNRSADYREVEHYYRTLPPAEDSALAPLLSALGLQPQPGERKGERPWWLRLLGG